MKYEGQVIQCSTLEGNIVELQFDSKDDSANTLGQQAIRELQEVIGQIHSKKNLKGLLITSKKDSFILGADVTEFLGHFEKSEEQLVGWVQQVHSLFSAIEDLSIPSVTAIQGFALGGGFELALTTSYRVVADNAKVGLPETKLGIFPGWGGTVRLSRLVGADTAIEWIASGEHWNAETALKVGAVDAIVSPENLQASALGVLQQAIDGKLNWKKRHEEKTAPLRLNKTEATMVFESAKAFVGAKAGSNYPAPVAAIQVIQQGAQLSRDEALAIEAREFARVAKTPTASSLIGLFLGDQFLKKSNKKLSKGAKPTEVAAVLGAGIMGGGIAYQSATKGIPVYMKDIQPKAIELGLKEATKILDKLVVKKKMSSEKMADTLNRIRPTLSYGDFSNVDFVVEAVVEKEEVKKAVLIDVEKSVKPGAILSSNTSTIPIDRLASVLQRPENFCGMHFFNPVPRMPLVEIIRGKKTSPETIAAAVAYSVKIGKTPVVVNDCTGFLINRVLFPYFAGFSGLVSDGVDFRRIDRVMEKYGWPMGPAFLLDVVGIDTACHADSVMANAYPDRMGHTGKLPIEILFENQRLGQKNMKGFYSYTPDKKGPPKKTEDPVVFDLIKPAIKGQADVSDEDIVDRMMLPMIIESSRCLEDDIVASPIEVDVALVYGLGFPPFRGGALRYADQVGLKEICKKAEKHASLGKLYSPTEQMKKLARDEGTFYGQYQGSRKK